MGFQTGMSSALVTLPAGTSSETAAATVDSGYSVLSLRGPQDQNSRESLHSQRTQCLNM